MVTNVGSVAGNEVVQFYASFMVNFIDLQVQKSMNGDAVMHYRQKIMQVRSTPSIAIKHTSTIMCNPSLHIQAKGY